MIACIVFMALLYSLIRSAERNTPRLHSFNDLKDEFEQLKQTIDQKAEYTDLNAIRTDVEKLNKIIENKNTMNI